VGAYICPRPGDWDKQYKLLKGACQRRQIDPAGIPVPLILDGWWYSSDADKKERWEAMLAWAEQNGIADLVAPLNSETGFKGDDQ